MRIGKRSFGFFMVLVMLGSLNWHPAGICAEQAVFAPAEKSKAYQQYMLRPKNERSKLLYLMDRFRDTQVQVIYDGYTYNARKSAVYARNYLVKHHKKNEIAETWLKKHAYRSAAGGEIIYFKFPDGRKRPLRDVLLEELESLRRPQTAS